MASDFNARIPVTSSGNIFNVIGYINAQSGMVVDFQDNLKNLGLVAISNGIVDATGASGDHYYGYHHLVSIREVNATGYTYPTGTNSFPFA